MVTRARVRQAWVHSRRPVRTWDVTNGRTHTEFRFAALEVDETARLPLFEHLLDYGVALLRDMPTGPNMLLRVGDWLGHVPANRYADASDQSQVRNIRIDPSVSCAGVI